MAMVANDPRRAPLTPPDPSNHGRLAARRGRLVGFGPLAIAQPPLSGEDDNGFAGSRTGGPRPTTTSATVQPTPADEHRWRAIPWSFVTRFVQRIKDAFPVVRRVDGMPPTPVPREEQADGRSDDLEAKSAFVFDLAVEDLNDLTASLDRLRTQAGVGLTLLIGASAFLVGGIAAAAPESGPPSTRLAVVAAVFGVVGLVVLTWAVGPVRKVPRRLRVEEAVRWLEIDRRGETTFTLAGYRHSLLKSFAETQPQRRNALMLRSQLVRVGLSLVTVEVGLLLVILFGQIPGR